MTKDESRKIGGQPIVPVDEQDRFINVLIYGDPGIGKGHPKGTMILTPNGYRLIEDLHVGDRVISSDGMSAIITGVHDRGTLPVNRVTFNDGTSVLVDDEHLWKTRNKNANRRGSDYKVLDTITMKDKLHQKWYIPLVAPVQMDEARLPLSPYAMGVLLGDGSFRSSTIRLSTDETTRANFEKCLPTGVTLTEGYDAYIVTDRGQDNPVLDEIKRCGLHGLYSSDKFIPEEYLYSSYIQRLNLLRGLMDTDGEIVGNNAGFSTTSAMLADGVEFLVQSLGGIVRRSTKNPKYDYKGEKHEGKLAHLLHINMPEGLNPFLSRNDYVGATKYLPTRIVESIEPESSAEVICLSVDSPDNTYVTEHCIVTHNTVLAGSASNVIDMSPVLLVDIEGGTMSLHDFYPEVDVVRVPKWRDLQRVYDELYRGDHEFKTVIIDSLTEAQKFSMEQVLLDTEGEKGHDPDVPRMRDWGKNIEQMRRLVRAYRDLPMNVVFTALAHSERNKRGKTIYKPQMNGKVKSEIPAFLDIVLYMYIKEKDGAHNRYVVSQATEEIIAKDRSNRLPMVVENPTMEKLYGLIVGDITKEDLTD